MSEFLLSVCFSGGRDYMPLPAKVKPNSGQRELNLHQGRREARGKLVVLTSNAEAG